MSRDVTDELIAELDAADEDSAEAWKRRALQAEAAVRTCVRNLHLRAVHGGRLSDCPNCQFLVRRLIPAAEEETR